MCQLKLCDRVSFFLHDLHWLPVRYRVQYKLCTLIYAIHHVHLPAYLSELVSTVTAF